MSKSICSVEICQRPVWARGWCSPHWYRWKTHGDVQADIPIAIYKTKPRRGCDVEGCPEPHAGLGYCARHYASFKRTGDPIPRINIPGGGPPCIDAKGYVRVYRNGRRIFEHRLVMEEVMGRTLLSNENVHHLNGDRQDNRPENLEIWVESQPPGQRIPDLLAWAHEIIDRYESESV